MPATVKRNRIRQSCSATAPRRACTGYIPELSMSLAAGCCWASLGIAHSIPFVYISGCFYTGFSPAPSCNLIALMLTCCHPNPHSTYGLRYCIAGSSRVRLALLPFMMLELSCGGCQKHTGHRGPLFHEELLAPTTTDPHAINQYMSVNIFVWFVMSG
jgi:hypothetical protein